MGVKVFVLGRPGSGKSTAVRHLNYLSRNHGRTVAHFNDYEILLEMFLADTEHRRFRPTAHNGFDAIDLSVLDEALVELESRIAKVCSVVDLLTIEFARDDYRNALKQFTPAFLKDAYFLYLDADIETCLRRVHKRVECSSTLDDHPSFSDEIFRQYYAKDNRPYIAEYLQVDFGIMKTVKIIENTHSLPGFLLAVEQFANAIFTKEYGPLVSVLGTGR